MEEKEKIKWNAEETYFPIKFCDSFSKRVKNILDGDIVIQNILEIEDKIAYCYIAFQKHQSRSNLIGEDVKNPDKHRKSFLAAQKILLFAKDVLGTKDMYFQEYIQFCELFSQSFCQKKMDIEKIKRNFKTVSMSEKPFEVKEFAFSLLSIHSSFAMRGWDVFVALCEFIYSRIFLNTFESDTAKEGVKKICDNFFDVTRETFCE